MTGPFFLSRPGEGDLRDFARGAADLAAESAYLRGKDVHLHVLLSPGAGAFRRKRRFEKLSAELASLRTEGGVGEKGNIRTTIHVARYPGHPGVIAADMAESMLKDDAKGKAPPDSFLMTLGGDGTHLEVLSALVDMPDGILSRITFFRLPLGTGNDGADADTLSSAFRVLGGEGGERKVGAVRISPRGLPPFHAFNIASFGIDAFVTGMTNRLKNCLPGDVYKLIADASTVLYEPLYGVAPMFLRALSAEGEQTLEGEFILVAFGASGRRSYGDHKWILPGEENLCVVRTRSLREKLALKPHIYAGTHKGRPGVEILKAKRLVIEYSGRLPVQTDGEARVLGREHFPCILELLPPRLKTLHRLS